MYIIIIQCFNTFLIHFFICTIEHSRNHELSSGVTPVNVELSTDYYDMDHLNQRPHNSHPVTDIEMVSVFNRASNVHIYTIHRQLQHFYYYIACLNC